MLESIMNRRSIRSYTSEPVTEAELHQLLDAAMHAPSAVNRQPWHFVVIDDREVLNALAEAHPYAKMLYQAPACIAVCVEPQGPYAVFDPQDCAAATMNILNGAYEMGLGTCWMGVMPRPDRMQEVRTVLQLPDHIQPFCLIAVGHPTETPASPDRYRPEKVHRNRW